MSVNNNIPVFAASDIEKYHKGLLSAAEMHRMEKAALDDPFLADAMEGYTTPGVNVAADIAELKKRLSEKSEEEKVIPMYSKSTAKPFAWLRVAAAVVIIGGAALLANQFINKTPTDKTVAATTDTPKETAAVTSDTNKVEPANTTSKGLQKTKQDAPETEIAGNGAKVQDGIGEKGEPIVALPAASDKVSGVTSETKDNAKRDFVKTEVANPAVKEKLAELNAPKEEARKKEVDVDNGFGITGKAKNVTVARKAAPGAVNNTGFFKTYHFRGRITDSANNGLAFAKVYNPADNNAGTYTDALGNFTLTYPDSLLQVNIKALGFENSTAKLQTNLVSNRVVMQDDRSISQFVISNKQVNTNQRSNNYNNRQLIEPEPADGWVNYDTYIANNLQVPEEFSVIERKTDKAVQVSFEVDKNGEPINITVEKSLCGSCDKEAIRLVKEGPKWKRNANKNGRTTVTINF